MVGKKTPVATPKKTVVKKEVPVKKKVVRKKAVKKPVVKRKAGQPTKYRAVFVEQVYKLCLLGAKDTEICDFFKVRESTLNNWKNKYPKFLESIKKAKYDKDNAVVKSLLERAMGYSHKEEKIFCSEGQIIRAETTKQYPPDVAAMIFWLKNRQPGEWRDKQVTELEMPEGLPSLLDLFGAPVEKKPDK